MADPGRKDSDRDSQEGSVGYSSSTKASPFSRPWTIPLMPYKHNLLPELGGDTVSVREWPDLLGLPYVLLLHST